MPSLSHKSRDWALLLGGAVCLALALAFLNWFLFIRRSAETAPTVGAPAVSFSRERLDEVLASFEARRTQFESALRTLPSVADPAK